MRQNISPCKCGCDPLLFKVGDWKQYYLFRCPACGRMWDKPDIASRTIEEAALKWNLMLRLEKDDE